MIDIWSFEGRWHLTRHIDDRAGSQSGRLAGTATFARDGAGLTLTETGTLRLTNGGTFKATRRSLWRPGITVLFEDGRPFHSFTADAPQAHHNCPPDSYDVTYDFDAWPDWEARWTVKGPRKDYTMVSRYTRS
ncbi:DUF6314 family protein [Pseudaestuariivita sp.]|uniref:DUF6314 family protein n=1 Tax=Pseudaestuariivita sp. TaxID=2211669 RepID=UPI0040592B82